MHWYGRGENMLAARRNELRKVVGQHPAERSHARPIVELVASKMARSLAFNLPIVRVTSPPRGAHMIVFT